MTDAPDPLIAIETEAALLGAMLLKNDLISTYADRIAAADFVEPVHQRIFSAMLRFRAKGALASPVTLRPVFQNDPASLGGDYLSKLADSNAVLVGHEDFAAQLVDFAVRRRVRDQAREALRRIDEDLETPVAEIVAPVQETAWATVEIAAEPTHDLGGMLGLVRARAQRLAAGGTVGIENALISDLNEAIGVLEPGYLILAGRPGMGKSTLASSAALGWALNGHPVSYLQLEMSAEAQAMRVASDAAYAMGHRIRHVDIRKNTLKASELRALDEVEQKVGLLPITYRAMGSCSLRQLEAEVARQAAFWAALGKRLEVVVVDYLGLVTVTDSQGRVIDDPRKRVAAVSAGLVQIQKRYGVVVIALAQLNRSVEGRQDKRPVLSDLKESGDLEQDADVVMFVYREEYYLQQARPKAGDKGQRGEDALLEWETDMAKAKGRIDLIVGKNRHSEVRTRTARYLGEYFAVRGSELADPDDDGPDLFQEGSR